MNAATRESRRAGHSAAEALKNAHPSSQSDSLTGHGHGTRGGFADLLIGALTAYSRLPDDLRPPVGTCVLVERGRDTDVKGHVIGYDARGVAVSARFAFLGELRVYIPWSAVRAMIEVPE